MPGVVHIQGDVAELAGGCVGAAGGRERWRGTIIRWSPFGAFTMRGV